MFLKLIVITIVTFSHEGFSKTIEVASNNVNYILEIDGMNISLKGSLVKLHLKKSECSKKISSNFIKKTNYLLDSFPLSKNKKKMELKLVIDNIVFYEHAHSKRGNYFLHLPRELQRMKIQEKILCSESK